MSPLQYRIPSAQPLVSILIRTLWRSTLAESLDSIAAQTYPYLEVVLIDALGVPPEPIRDCGNLPVRVISKGRRLKRGESANVGLESAQGDLLLFLDDDDWLLPEHLAGLVEALQARADALAAYAGIECRRQKATGDWEVVHVFNQPYDPIRLLVENYLPIHAVLFARTLVEQGVRFDESLAVYEDWDFWLQLSALTPFIHVDRVTGVYRIQGGSGFGVRGGEDRRIDPGLAAFFGKWRNRWTTEQLLRIAEYAKHQPLYLELRARCEAERQSLEQELAAFHRLRAEHGELQVRVALGESEKRALQAEIQRLEAQLAGLQSSLQSQSELLELLGVWSLRDAWQCLKDLELGRSVMGRFVWFADLTARPAAWIQERLAPLGAPLGRLRAHAVHLREIARFHGLWQLVQALMTKLRQDSRRPGLKALWQVAQIANLRRVISPASQTPGLPQGETEAVIALLVDCAQACTHTFWTLENLAHSRHLPPFEVLLIHPAGHPIGPLLDRDAPGVKHLGIETGSDIAGRYRAILAATAADWLIELDCLEAKPHDWLWRIIQAPRRLFDETLPVGALRPKLIGADGRLIEFGQLRAPDGSLRPFGAGDDPGAPAYGTPRLVDGASSMGLILNRQAVEAVLGREEPDSPNRALPTLQAFLDQLTYCGFGIYAWPEISLVHPTLTAPSQVSPRPRVLVIDAVMLTPDQDSGSLRMSRLLGLLNELGWGVSFIPSNLEPVEPYATYLRQRGIEVLTAPQIASLPDYLKRCGSVYELVILSRASVAEQYFDLVREYAPQAKIWFDTVDLHFLREQRAAELKDDPAALKRAAWRRRQELDLIARADLTLLVSPVEREWVSQSLPQARLALLSNIHDPAPTPAPFATRDAILFIGGFNHDPNIDAVQYYVTEIHPRVLATLGPIPTLIVGSRPPPEIRALHDPEYGLYVLGYVERVEPLFDRARLSIAPLRYGAGVKGKVNQSMAYGVPVVATPCAAEGMGLVHEIDVLIGPDAESFADCVIRLYRDQPLWERLRQGGLENIERHFSYRVARATLECLLAEVSA